MEGCTPVGGSATQRWDDTNWQWTLHPAISGVLRLTSTLILISSALVWSDSGDRFLRVDNVINLIDLKTPTVLSMNINTPILPTGITLVPDVPNALRLLTTDVSSGRVTAVTIDASVLP